MLCRYQLFVRFTSFILGLSDAIMRAPRRTLWARSEGFTRPIAEAIKDGPILPVMLRLATPTIGVLIVQTLVGLAETFYVSFLGTDALVGVSLVFPIWMLMTMSSSGGIGGGVASAISRAIGAGRRED